MKRAPLLALITAAALAGCGQESGDQHIERLQREYNAATAKEHRAECDLWGLHCK